MNIKMINIISACFPVIISRETACSIQSLTSTIAAEMEKPSTVPEDERDEIEYPPKNQVIPAMIAVVLAVFVVALVCCSSLSPISYRRCLKH